jgi:hypothetical protein
MNKVTNVLFTIGAEPHHPAVNAVGAPDLSIKTTMAVERRKESVAEGGIACGMSRLARKLKPDLSKAVWYGRGFRLSGRRH